MTKEEAFKEYEEWRNLGFGHSTMPSSEVLVMAMNSLRPITREQVEKGEWNNINPAVLKPGVSWVCRCTKCGCPQDYKHNFCPNCGAAQTDEAVEMVMERLRVLTNDN